MTDLYRHIDCIVGLPMINVAEVGKALGIRLLKERENPYWEFYEAGAGSGFERVYFNLSKQGPNWLLAWDYPLSHQPLESELDLSRYGAVKNIEVNPRIPPEGTLTHEFLYAALKVKVVFSAAKHRLRGAGLYRE
jgi:hypothetical protein